MITWYIDDLNEYQFYITDLWREWYVPKFNDMFMVVDEPYLEIHWMDTEKGPGGSSRMIRMDYRDVVDGYSGYVSNPSSAQDLKDQIDVMRVSAFNQGGGDILTAKAQLISHDGVSDTILAGGVNESVLIRNDSTATGLDWVAKSNIVAGGLTANDTESLDLTLTGSVLTGRVKKINLPPVSASQYNPIDNTTAHFNNTGILAQNAAANLRNIYPPAGILMGVHLDMVATATTGSGENITMNVRVNDTTNYLIATVGSTALVRVFENLAMNGGAGIAFNGTTDFYCYQMVNPLNYVTNPSAVGIQGYTIYYIT